MYHVEERTMEHEPMRMAQVGTQHLVQVMILLSQRILFPLVGLTADREGYF